MESDNVLAALSSRTKAIESEDTLKMIMMAVKSETAQESSKAEKQNKSEIQADLETGDEPKKAKKKTKKNVK